ncbi:uncharacterized protein LOC110458643 isoform X2 [Mizuhopecten yessoensis]|uniref:uncharacterized protein LOC110458643 isoform X2 n=1 Tax=Mizuhopecten yessoensis TaxID=6573 RepID=UPI000B45E795|nr:uncharacterized protein LOC110458643 isoform X2 [Mizuhopecten yessoensis]
MGLASEDHHRMRHVFRKISLCCIFLQRLQNSRQNVKTFHERSGPVKKSNFRVASLCFLFLRRLHAFDHEPQPQNTKHPPPQQSWSMPAKCSGGGRRQKRNSTKQKCTCCKLNTDSESGEEQTRTILTNTFRDIVPKLSRILVNQDPFSSSSIWTKKFEPQSWPSVLPWKDPNNKPKDTFETLEKRMHTLLRLCKGKQIPSDIEKEIGAYREYQLQVQQHQTGDISKLQVIRQKRKATHKMTVAIREFAEVIKWHGLPAHSEELRKESKRFREIVQLSDPSNSPLSSQFEDIFSAIANIEDPSTTPEEYMRQFNQADQSGTIAQKQYPHSSLMPYAAAAACMEEFGSSFSESAASYRQSHTSFYAQQTLKRNLAAFCKREEEVKNTSKKKRMGNSDKNF